MDMRVSTWTEFTLLLYDCGLACHSRVTEVQFLGRLNNSVDIEAVAEAVGKSLFPLLGTIIKGCVHYGSIRDVDRLRDCIWNRPVGKKFDNKNVLKA